MYRPILFTLTLVVLGVGLPGCGGCNRNTTESGGQKPKADETSDQSPPTKRTAKNGRQALLIGISTYKRNRPNNLDWWDLNSTRDVDAIEQVLKDQFEFKPEEIVVLRNEKATRQGILDAFAELVRATQENDVVYFHYSGHGQRVPDNTGEELDGWAQTIIPFDYKSRADYSQNLVNRDFRKLIADLKAKKPANVTLVFDCCFAGEITKGGDELIRGEAWRGDPPKPPETGKAKFDKGPIGIFPPKQAAAEGYVVLGASRYDLVAQETPDEHGQRMGLLTYALIQALRDTRPPSGDPITTKERGTTYRDLFGQINAVVFRRSHQQQTPQLEGEIDQVFLSGIVRRPSRFVEVRVPDTGSPITLQAGSLQGVTKGSHYALYPKDTKDFAKAQQLAEATVEGVKLGSATLVLKEDAKAKGADLNLTRAVERRHVYGDNRLKVDVRHLNLYHPQGKEVTEKIRMFDAVSPEAGGEGADLRVICRGKDAETERSVIGLKLVPEGLSWVVVRKDGSVAAAFPQDDKLVERIGLLLKDEARWRGILALKNSGPADPFKIEIQVVPVEAKHGADGLVTEVIREKSVPLTAGNRIAFAEGEDVVIKVRVDKKAKFDPFVAVLDLLPNGSVGLLWPKTGMNAAAAKIPADGKWFKFPAPPFVWRIALPAKPRYGAGTYTPVSRGEVFKVFATETYIPMNLLADPVKARGFNPRGGNLDPHGGDLADLIRAAVTGSRADPVGVDPEYWSAATVSIDIIAGQRPGKK